MESTALKPAPPPAGGLLQGQDGCEPRIDEGSALGDMITPRPAEEDLQEEAKAVIG